MENIEPPPAAALDSAVLVVQNGRLSGARRPLASPLTLIGQAPGCDLRLTIDGVNPLHCAVVQVPSGFLLRDLGSEQGTYVNRERVTTWPLATGDVIGVGPFLFRVELPAPESMAVVTADPPGLAAERDALRIQAAAVAAQQAHLTDDEAYLNQQRDALEKREQQIAEHLEDRQARLLELREELQQERDTFGEKKAILQAELAKSQKQAERERRRFTEARKRFKQRWLSYTAEKQTSLHQRDQQLLADEHRLRKEMETLQGERTRFAETRLRLNGEIELGRRELKQGWEELGLAQQRWDEALNGEHRDRDRHMRELEARESAVAEGERRLAAERDHWLDTRARLLKEIEGLEARVRNQRYQLQELQPQQPQPATVFPQPASQTRASHESPDVPEVVKRLADHLADQRRLLLEHWSQFVEIEQAWEQERVALVADAEAAEQWLREREQQLDGRDQALTDLEGDLHRRRAQFDRTRAELESWQTQLTLRQTHWEGERASHLAAVEAREQTATDLIAQLEAVRQRRQARRRQEVDELRQARSVCETARQEYLVLLRRFQERQAEVAREQRVLAARTVAAERYRLELVGGAANSPAAEKRLEKLRRRSLKRLEAAEHKVSAQRRTLLAESRHLEERAGHLQQREEALTTLQEQLSRRQAEWEQEQIAHGQSELPRERELRQLRSQHDHDVRQLAALRDEVERVAWLLFEGDTEAARLRMTG